MATTLTYADDNTFILNQDGKEVTVARRGLTPDRQAELEALPPTPGAFGTEDTARPRLPAIVGGFKPREGESNIGYLWRQSGRLPVMPAELFVPEGTPGTGFSVYPPDLMAGATKAAEGVGTGIGKVIEVATAPAGTVPQAPATPTPPKAGMIPPAEVATGRTSTSVSMKGPTAPSLAGMKRAIAEQERGINEMADAQAGRSNALATVYSEQQQKMAEFARQETEALSEEQQVVQGAIKDFTEQSKRVAALQVDPQRFWHSKSTGTKILAAISMGLGAAGAALSGTRNTAADIIQGEIDRDIRAQEVAIANARAGLQDNLTIFGLWKDYYGSARVGRAAAQAFYLKQAELAIQQRSAEFDAPENKARAKFLIGQLHEKAAAAEFNLGIEIMKASGVDTSASERWIPGTISLSTGGPGLVPQKGDEAAKIRQANIAFTQAAAKVARLEELRATYGAEPIGKLVGGQVASEMETIYGDLFMLWKNMEQLGALQPGEIGLVERILGKNPADVGPRLQKIKALRAAIDEKHRMWLRGYGLMRAEDALQIQAAGQGQQ